MDAGVRHWCTDAVAAPQRFDYWVGAICDCFLEMEADSSARGSFSASLRSVPLHTLRLNAVSGSAQQVYRSRRSISRSSDNFYYLLCKQSTPCGVTQQQAGAAWLLPGDLTLIDSRRPYELQFAQSVDICSLQLPIGWLDTWLPDAEHCLGRRLDGSSGWGQVLAGFVRQLLAAPGALPPLVQADQLGSLIALGFGAPVDEATAATRDLATRIEDQIRSRFAEPGLAAPEVAMALGISVRTLHRALAARQRSFAQCLLQQRIGAAQRMLATPAFNRLSTAEIGRRAGWPEPSHFTRLYRQSTGRTPAQARRDASANGTPRP